jgi:hypothetical protein
LRVETIGRGAGIEWVGSHLTGVLDRCARAAEAAYGFLAASSDVPVLVCDEDAFSALVPEKGLIQRFRQLESDPELEGAHRRWASTLTLGVHCRWPASTSARGPWWLTAGDEVLLLAADRFRGVAAEIECAPERLLDVVTLHELAHPRRHTRRRPRAGWRRG